jgi:hypothetical protein
MSVFRDLVDAGLSLIRDAAGESIRYYRGDKFRDMVAVPGNGQRKGQPVIGSQQDWLIEIAEMRKFCCLPRTPERGDLIEIKIANSRLRYEVLPQDGEDVYRIENFSQLRVHSKLIFCGEV